MFQYVINARKVQDLPYLTLLSNNKLNNDKKIIVQDLPYLTLLSNTLTRVKDLIKVQDLPYLTLLSNYKKRGGK